MKLSRESASHTDDDALIVKYSMNTKMSVPASFGHAAHEFHRQYDTLTPPTHTKWESIVKYSVSTDY